MKKYNAKNERLKRDYLRYLAEAYGKSPATIDGIKKSLLRYEDYRQFKDFGAFHRDEIIAFKKHLSIQKAEQSGQVLSKATVLTTLQHLKGFFRWLAMQPGYKSKIHMPDIEYFNLSEKETRIAKTQKFRDMPTLSQIQRALFSMPVNTEIERRNRAMIAFTILTGIRDSALISLKLKHIDLNQELVKQDPAEVKTKFSKRIDTYFFPIGDDIKQIVIEWVRELIEVKHYGYDAPLFPKTHIALGDDYAFKAEGLEPTHWAGAGQVRKVFRDAFAAAGLPYYNPHSFRSTLTHIGQQRCRTAEEFKAWSQNLGHESTLTTFTSYGRIDAYRQGDIIKKLVI